MGEVSVFVDAVAVMSVVGLSFSSSPSSKIVGRLGSGRSSRSGISLSELDEDDCSGVIVSPNCINRKAS